MDSSHGITWKGEVFVCFCAILIGSLIGCATFGVGEYSKDQAVLEAAAGMMMLEYLSLEDVGAMSKVDIANALLCVGDESVQAMGYISFSSLIQSRINSISKGRMNPQVLTIYMLTVAILEKLESSEG